MPGPKPSANNAELFWTATICFLIVCKEDFADALVHMCSVTITNASNQLHASGQRHSNSATSAYAQGMLIVLNQQEQQLTIRQSLSFLRAEQPSKLSQQATLHYPAWQLEIRSGSQKLPGNPSVGIKYFKAHNA